MTKSRFLLFGLAAFAAALPGIMLAQDGKPEAEFASKATWKIPAAAEVRKQALDWMATRNVDAETKTRVEALWSGVTGDKPDDHALEMLAATFAAVDPQAKALVLLTAESTKPGRLPDVSWLADEKVAPLVRNNLGLLYGRWLAQEAKYDEAAAVLGALSPENVVDPASLLFYQAVIQQRTLDRSAGLKTITRLLEQESAIPKRYASVAKLMQADLELLEEESLDHISRRMDDIRRRLAQGSAGVKTRELEDGVLASLDKMIKDQEDAQKKQREQSQKSGDKQQKDGQPKSAKDKQGKDKQGKDKQGKDKSGKKSGKDKDGKEKSGKKGGKDKDGKDKSGKKGGKDKNGKDKDGKDGSDKFGKNKDGKDKDGKDGKQNKQNADKRDMKQYSDKVQPMQPLGDSQVMGGFGAGEVDDNSIGSEAGWGDLDPRQRQEALQQISQEFPAHYRDMIEQYFRRLAIQGGDDE